MTPIVHDTLRVNDDGFVKGIAHTKIKLGHLVQVGITSYEYLSRSDARMNHVPNVVVVEQSSGNIVAEPYCHDGQNAEKVIENARKTIRSVFDRLDEYVDPDKLEQMRRVKEDHIREDARQARMDELEEYENDAR